jgi:2-keto-4-pentenoate hydratase/2-oxohepta-3-ene-1,7-dioic acid hydratase in catechol pathway
VIGAYCRNVSPEQAAGSIFGYTCANDFHDNDWLRTDLSVWRGQGRENYSPIGPGIGTLSNETVAGD